MDASRQCERAAPPDYQEIRDRVLKSLTTGRGSFASTSPQYRAASRALDRFIAQIEGDAKAPQKARLYRNGKFVR